MESFRDNPMLTTASMPIPSRGRITTDLSEFGFLFDGSNSPSLFGDMGIASTNISLDTMDNSNQTNEMNTTDIKDINTQLWNETPNVISLKSEPFQMDGDDIFQVDESDLIQEGSIYTNHINLHQLQPAVLSSSMNLPNQILQQNHHGGGGGSYSASNHVQSGIAIGQDVLYDDMTNASSNSFDFGAPSSSSNYNIKNNMINLNSSAITFSPGSHNSSNSSLLYNNSVTPPPPHQQQQQNSSPVSHVPKSPAASSSLTSAFSKQIHHNNKRNNNFLQNNSQQQYSTLHNLLKKEYTSPDSSILGQSVPAAPSGSMLMSGTALSPGGFNNKRSILHQQFHSGGSSAQNSRLSSSAPTHLGLEQLWQRREPRQHLLSTGSLVEAESTSSLSTGGVLSPEAQDFSHDEGYSDDDDDSDHYEDYSSDGDSDNEMSKMNHCNNNSKKERFFWQYNVQAKGPKGQRLVIKKQMEDPHVLNEVTDPVFSPHCSVRGIKHSGKARKGDGNDLTPNPRKLQCIGKELDKLSRIINDMTPVSELPFNARPKTRKEKNKLASRACRLKKKAQHEANKIKLHGLEMEHRRLLNGISQIKQMIVTKCNQSNATEMSGEELVQQLDKINRSATKLKIAGSSTEFVNKILEKIKSGVPRGGLDEIH